MDNMYNIGTENMKKNSNSKSIIFIVLAVIVIGVGVFFFTRGGSKTSIGDFSISTTNLVVKKGSTNTFDISLKNAVGRIDITSSDDGVASIEDKMVWLESINKEKADKQTISVSGKKEGKTQIIVSLGDVATFDTIEALTGSLTIDVTVE